MINVMDTRHSYNYGIHHSSFLSLKKVKRVDQVRKIEIFQLVN